MNRPDEPPGRSTLNRAARHFKEEARVRPVTGRERWAKSPPRNNPRANPGAVT
jgi:hypothetical protein